MSAETKLHTGTPEDMGRRFIDAWKRAERGEEVDELHLTFPSKQELLTYLLREHGIGIASLDEMKARTMAVASGELKLPPDEPKVWFTSIDSLVKNIKAIGERATKRAAKKEAKERAAYGLTPIELYIQEHLDD